MAKPIRYPKKFRQKLEKIAADREAREAAPAKSSNDDFNPFNIFLHSFLPRQSAHMLHTKFDDLLWRIEQQWYLKEPVRPQVITVPPPWEGKFKPGASQ